MRESKYILSIDQGTSSTKSLIFDVHGQAIAKGVEPLNTIYYENGFVEQDPEDIYQNVLTAVRRCLEEFEGKGYFRSDITAVGISNQRETFVVWDSDGNPLHPAIVWNCKRSVRICEDLSQKGLSYDVQQKTGLVIDPYFSATKLIWLYQNNEKIRTAIQNKAAYFGTIDSWLLFKLTKGRCYLTDHTNASRTLLFNIHSLSWDEALIERLGLTGIQLPEVRASAANFGVSDFDGLFDQPVTIAAMIGDSHAAAFGEGCFDAGTAKATLGTGCSILMNIGEKPQNSANGMVTTINWSTEKQVSYALEGVIVSCGATIEWLKNELRLFDDSSQTESLARAVPDNGGVYLIPAFSGLGSPHWQMDRKASITGLSFGSQISHIVRAGLESIPYQIEDVIAAMEKDTSVPLKALMTNGGLTSNTFVMQLLADLLGKPVFKSAMPDVSALGAAYMAGIGKGIFKNGIDNLRKLRNEKIEFAAGEDTSLQQKNYREWLQAIKGKI
ncbi:FGGY family carbohydrate kinase [Arachidicoccus terrestris]|uniref:FGGY family carbohydrate kinase n=1 Tax=Arachidicoccus terrestris TaxID=2875539 RepID=UPI001CC39C90|nr:glycerol kinase GlpK [Arachidicoccus terrestris]UAY54014.1 glycerol kinase GlpK [Arachidicoccus terrestris]